MSKQFALAMFYMGKGYEIASNEYDLEDETDDADDMRLAKHVMELGAIALDIVEECDAIDMTTPENAHREIYQDFGYWFGEYMGEHSREYPNIDACVQRLLELALNEVFTGFTAEVDNRIIKTIKARYNVAD